MEGDEPEVRKRSLEHGLGRRPSHRKPYGGKRGARPGMVPVFLSRQTSASRRQAGAHFDCQRNSHFVALRSNWMHPEVFLHFQVTPKEVDRGIRFTS